MPNTDNLRKEIDSAALTYMKESLDENKLTVAKLTIALDEIRKLQPHALDITRRNNFIFDDIGNEPGSWKHLAFTFYTLLCQAETIASHALDAK